MAARQEAERIWTVVVGAFMKQTIVWIIAAAILVGTVTAQQAPQASFDPKNYYQGQIPDCNQNGPTHWEVEVDLATAVNALDAMRADGYKTVRMTFTADHWIVSGECSLAL